MTKPESPLSARGTSTFHDVVLTMVFLMMMFASISVVYGVIVASSVLDTGGYGFAAIVLAAVAFAILELIALVLVGRWAW